MMRHKMRLKPFNRLLGNAVLAHILGDGCYGRMILTMYSHDDRNHEYIGTFNCMVCGKLIDAHTNKSGPRIDD